MTISLTIGEKIWLWRRRLDQSLLETCRKLDTTKGRLVSWEADREDPPADLKRRVAALVPTPEEDLRILRRRSGLGSRGAAQAFGVSHVSLLRLERAGDRELRRWYVHMINDTDRHHYLFTAGRNSAMPGASGNNRVTSGDTPWLPPSVLIGDPSINT